MQEAVLEDLCADVSESKCERAKKIVMEQMENMLERMTTTWNWSEAILEAQWLSP